MKRISSSVMVLFPVLVALFIVPGHGQEIKGCARTDLSDPPRSAFVCENGLVFEAEAGADFRMPSEAVETAPASLDLNGSAAFIELQPGHGPFQIQTPYAIASVRGTKYIVDVHDMQTSVFVVEGVVAVSRIDGSDAVDLVAGEGVDVSGDDPMTVRQWPQDRVLALLARFAR